MVYSRGALRFLQTEVKAYRERIRMDKKIFNEREGLDLIGVQIDLGASQKGVAMGPTAIRYAGIKESLHKMGFDVRDKGDIIPLIEGASRPDMLAYEQVIDANKRLYEAVYETLENKRMPIVLGGDHSIAAGSISAVSKFYEDKGPVGVIWIDAHGDWNSNETSETGNMHGMPYSAVCGYGPDEMVDYGQKPCFLHVKNCVQVGARDLDLLEAKRMKEAGMNTFPIYDIDKRGIYEVMKDAIRIASEGTIGIHLSFDVDALDPTYAPGTGTPVQNGLTEREAFLAVEMLAESGKLLSIDMVEVNPILDEINKTAVLASSLVQSALGKTVY